MGGGSFFQFEPDPGSNEENFVTSSLNQIETEEFLVGVEFRGQMGASGRDPSSLSCQTPLHPCDTRAGGRTCENILPPLMGRPCWRTCENPRVTRGGQNISKLRLSILVSFGHPYCVGCGNQRVRHMILMLRLGLNAIDT